MLWLSWEHPTMFYGALAVALIVMITATVMLFKFVRGLRKRLSNHFVPTKLGDASMLERGGVGRS
jgi:tellurite resistance protein TehA-like permease